MLATLVLEHELAPQQPARIIGHALEPLVERLTLLARGVILGRDRALALRRPAIAIALALPRQCLVDGLRQGFALLRVRLLLGGLLLRGSVLLLTRGPIVLLRLLPVVRPGRLRIGRCRLPFTVVLALLALLVLLVLRLFAVVRVLLLTLLLLLRRPLLLALALAT
ncbi:MAG: hypothetical protein KF903_09730, partial [Dokdonella sp.]|uniref:hypothetical protein n=1 Tax=Dokdonella sp. TaxID=2291710 RepID=UPI0025B877B8